MSTTNLPIGTPVLAYPGVRSDDPLAKHFGARILDTVTRSEPWKTGAGDWIVKVEGRLGGVALTHIDLKHDTEAPR